jgi:hypothetical protein
MIGLAIIEANAEADTPIIDASAWAILPLARPQGIWDKTRIPQLEAFRIPTTLECIYALSCRI